MMWLGSDSFEWWKTWYGCLSEHQRLALHEMIEHVWALPTIVGSCPVAWRYSIASRLPTLPIFNAPEWSRFIEALANSGVPTAPASLEALGFWTQLGDRVLALRAQKAHHSHYDLSCDDEVDHEAEAEAQEAEDRRLYDLEMRDIEEEHDTFMDLEYFHQEAESSETEPELEQDVELEGDEVSDPPGDSSVAPVQPQPTGRHEMLYPPLKKPWEVTWTEFYFLEPWEDPC